MASRSFLIGSQVRKCGTRTFATSRTSAQESGKEKYVCLTEEEGVRTITLNHQASYNALSLEMLKAIQEGVKMDEGSANYHSIVITAVPGKVFSAGHNLRQLTAENQSLHKEVFKACSQLMASIRESPVPVIAAVDGLAAAAGCQLVAGCDLAVCTERSTFSTPGANIGIFCSTPAIPLLRNVPQKIGMYMLFTGAPITAREALQAGLVSRVAANDSLDEEVGKITSRIATKSHSVIHLGKKFVYEQMNCDIETAYVMGSRQMIKNLEMDDAQEGIKSFLEKRKPVWTHKN